MSDSITTQPDVQYIDSWTHDDIRNFYDLYPNLTILTYAGMLGMTVSEVKTVLMSK